MFVRAWTRLTASLFTLAVAAVLVAASLIVLTLVAVALSVGALAGTVPGPDGVAGDRSPNASAAVGGAEAPVPRFEPGPCPVDTPEGTDVDCGELVVEENRSDPSVRPIRVPVAILRSQHPDPAEDPIVFVTGGPGSDAMDAVGLADSPFTERRDVIVLGQRGTRYATPELTCPGVERAYASSIQYADPAAAETDAVADAAADCANRLRDRGIDLSSYDTAAIAGDVAALREALGYDQYTIWGVSYGTRVAQAVLRDHPDGVRAAVLDSPVPLDVDQFEVHNRNLYRALRAVDDACAADGDCPRRNGSLVATFESAVDRAEETPITTSMSAGATSVADPETEGRSRSLSLAGDDVLTAVHEGLYDADTARWVPFVLGQLASGNDAVTAPIASSGLAGATGNSWGVYYSVTCQDELPFNDPAAIAADRHYRALDGNGHLLYRSMPAVCDAWDVPPSSAAADRAVESDVPTLVLAGRFDPITPPAWAHRIAGNFSNAQVLVDPDGAHAVAFDGRCLPGVVSTFVDRPTERVAAACLEDSSSLSFPTTADVHPTAAPFRLSSAIAAGEPLAMAGLAAAAAALTAALTALAALLRRRGVGGLVRDWRVGLAAMTVTGTVLLVVGLASVLLLVAPAVLGFGLPAGAVPLLFAPLAIGPLAAVLLANAATRRWRGTASHTERWIAVIAFSVLVVVAWLIHAGFVVTPW